MDSEWQRTGGTLSDKTARKEFALTQDGVIPQSLSCDHYTRSGGQMHALMHQLNPYLVGAAPIHDPPRCPPKRPR